MREERDDSIFCKFCSTVFYKPLCCNLVNHSTIRKQINMQKVLWWERGEIVLLLLWNGVNKSLFQYVYIDSHGVRQKISHIIFF
jgi:hypothetical protein